jgi:hypothetical protein
MKRSRRCAGYRNPDDCWHGCRDEHVRVITDESIGRKGYVGHESALPKVACSIPS